MCEHGVCRTVTLEQRIAVDACIADEIVALNRDGVHTVGSCCGHGRGEATAVILPSCAARAREMGYTVIVGEDGEYPRIVLRPRTPARSEAIYRPEDATVDASGRVTSWPEHARAEAAGGEERYVPTIIRCTCGALIHLGDGHVCPTRTRPAAAGLEEEWRANAGKYLGQLATCLDADGGDWSDWREVLHVLADEYASLRQQLAEVASQRDHMKATSDPFIEWAQDRDRFDSGRWAGFNVYTMVMTEFDEMRQQLAAAREGGPLTGCCVECGRPPEITVAHVNGVRCISAHPRCACAAGLHIWPAGSEPAIATTSQNHAAQSPKKA